MDKYTKNIICPYCGKQFSKYGIKGHIWRKHTPEGQNHQPYKNKKPWNKNLSKETDKRILCYSKKIKETFMEKGHNWVGKKHKIESKNKMSKTRTEMYIAGWEATSCGKSKKYIYDSPIAGKIRVDGKWELAVARYLDSKKVKWRRNTKRFKYINKKGKISTYCPDFWADDWKIYIEVKGYETSLDRCKWKQFPCNLQVWKASKLIKLNLITKSGEMV